MAVAMQQWQAKAAETLAIGNNLVNKLPELARLYDANGLESVITSTPDGQVVPGGTLTKERLIALVAMFDSFSTWLSTPVGAGAPPIATISVVD